MAFGQNQIGQPTAQQSVQSFRRRTGGNEGTATVNYLDFYECRSTQRTYGMQRARVRHPNLSQRHLYFFDALLGSDCGFLSFYPFLYCVRS